MSDSAASGRTGLCIPPVFYGGEANPSGFAALRRMLDEIGDVTHPHNPWYVADNLLTYRCAGRLKAAAGWRRFRRMRYL